MIGLLSKVHIIDNSGGLTGRCIKILKPIRSHAQVGDLILLSLIKTIKTPGTNQSASKVKKGDVVKGVIVRTKSSDKSVKWDENAVVLVKTNPKTSDYTPIGTRIKGPISSSLKNRIGCQKIISLAKLII